MIVYGQAEQAIRNWIKALAPSGVTAVIPANTGNPRPKRPFITALVTSLSSVTPAEYRALLDDDATMPVYRTLRIMVSLQAYGEDAQGILLAISQALPLQTKQYTLMAHGIGCISDDGVKDLSEDGHEQRAGLDIEFRAGDVVFDTVGSIGAVEIEGQAGSSEAAIRDASLIIEGG